MKKEIVVGLFIGFLIGGGIGLLFGQSTRKAAESNIKTDVSSGIVTIEFDAGKSLKQGFYNLF